MIPPSWACKISEFARSGDSSVFADPACAARHPRGRALPRHESTSSFAIRPARSARVQNSSSDSPANRKVSTQAFYQEAPRKGRRTRSRSGFTKSPRGWRILEPPAACDVVTDAGEHRDRRNGCTPPLHGRFCGIVAAVPDWYAQILYVTEPGELIVRLLTWGDPLLTSWLEAIRGLPLLSKNNQQSRSTDCEPERVR